MAGVGMRLETWGLKSPGRPWDETGDLGVKVTGEALVSGWCWDETGDLGVKVTGEALVSGWCWDETGDLGVKVTGEVAGIYLGG